MNNLPAGAENDTNAPYNLKNDLSHYCRNCDKDQIKEEECFP